MWTKAQRKEYRRRYYLAHRDDEIAKSAEWVENNRLRHNEDKRRWYARHQERLRAENKQRRQSAIDNIDATYVAHLLAKGTGGSATTLPRVLIEAKRAQLMLLRLTNNTEKMP